MKNVLRFLTLGLILVAVGAISVTSTIAQENLEECNAVYQKFLANRKGPDRSKLETAVAAGKDYLGKCGNLDQPDVKAYVEKQLPKVEDMLTEVIYTDEVITPFNESVPKKLWDVTFDKGKRILAKNPDFVDVMLVLASIGFDQAVANNDKFNGDAINMAKLALQKMSEGKPSVTGDFGAFAYRYKTAKCTDGKVNALGWMNYTIGYITFYRLKNQKDAAPYLYKSTQTGCETTTIGDIYRMIGSFYIEEFKKIDDERIKIIESTKTEEKPAGEETDETKRLFALQRGYMERIIDAYYRASKLTSDPSTKEAWLSRAKDFYGFRFEKDMTNFDTWVSNISTKPFPDPTLAVSPVPIEETKATTTTTTGATVISNEVVAPTNTETRPRTVDVSTATAKTTATSATPKAPAKKPVTKKKGTR